MKKTPQITRRENLVAFPGPFGGGSTSLYDAHGGRLDDTNIVVASPDHPVFTKEYRWAPARVEIPPDPQVVDDEVLYIGVARDHYGHFLLDSMSRMWGAMELDRPCLFLGADSVQGPFFHPIMNALDLPILSPDRPTLYRNIYVADAAMTNIDVHPKMDEPHLRVTDVLYGQGRGAWRVPVFLSRRGFQSKARNWIPDPQAEAELENAFSVAGYRIVRPETLPLSDQIAIFNESPKIAGLLGSAFHTALFSRRSYQGRLALLTFRPERKSGRYGLVDRIKSYEASYITCTTLDAERGVLSLDLSLAIQRLRELQFL